MHSDVGEGLRLPVFRLGARQFSPKPAEERILLPPKNPNNART